jgi:hypothetical protein
MGWSVNRDFDSHIISGTDTFEVFTGCAHVCVRVLSYFVLSVALTVVLNCTVQSQTPASVLGEGHHLQGSS